MCEFVSELLVQDAQFTFRCNMARLRLTKMPTRSTQPRADSKAVVRVRLLCPPPLNEPPTLRHVASRSTTWATPGPILPPKCPPARVLRVVRCCAVCRRSPSWTRYHNRYSCATVQICGASQTHLFYSVLHAVVGLFDSSRHPSGWTRRRSGHIAICRLAVKVTPHLQLPPPIPLSPRSSLFCL